MSATNFEDQRIFPCQSCTHRTWPCCSQNDRLAYRHRQPGRAHRRHIFSYSWGASGIRWGCFLLVMIFLLGMKRKPCLCKSHTRQKGEREHVRYVTIGCISKKAGAGEGLGRKCLYERVRLLSGMRAVLFLQRKLFRMKKGRGHRQTGSKVSLLTCGHLSLSVL